MHLQHTVTPVRMRSSSRASMVAAMILLCATPATVFPDDDLPTRVGRVSELSGELYLAADSGRLGAIPVPAIRSAPAVGVPAPATVAPAPALQSTAPTGSGVHETGRALAAPAHATVPVHPVPVAPAAK